MFMGIQYFISWNIPATLSDIFENGVLVVPKMAMLMGK
jgi:hypothetical protein